MKEIKYDGDQHELIQGWGRSRLADTEEEQELVQATLSSFQGIISHFNSKIKILQAKQRRRDRDEVRSVLQRSSATHKRKITYRTSQWAEKFKLEPTGSCE